MQIYGRSFFAETLKKVFIRVTTLTRFRCVVGLGLYRFLVFKILKTQPSLSGLKFVYLLLSFVSSMGIMHPLLQ